jgi:hypothetical protein
VVKLTRSQALEDARDLVEVLVDAHPDPYSGFGGALAFYRGFHTLVKNLPEGGIDSEELCDKLQAFVSQLRDGHTKLFCSGGGRLGLPLTFEVVENGLVVSGYYDPGYAWCIGSRVLEVEGLPVPRLLERVSWSAENEYVKLTELSWRIHSLSNGDTKLGLLTPRGSRVEVRLEHAEYGDLKRPKSRFSLPEPNNRIDLSNIDSAVGVVSDFAFGEVEGIPYFRIDGPLLYREAFEFYAKRMPSVLSAWGVPQPERLLERLEAFEDVFQKVLEEVRSQRRIIFDLRGASGGNSILVPMIVYGLFGYREAVTPREYVVTKRSKLLEAISGSSKEGLGYDFSDEDFYFRVKREGLTEELEEACLRRYNDVLYAVSSGLDKDWRGVDALRVCVATSARTFSAGFDIALSLWKRGAKLLGTTPSQVANCFIDTLPFKLKNSSIEGQVSTKLYVGLPERLPEMNILLRPHVELSYEYYRDSGFDPNATIALCVDELSRTPK